MFSSLRCTLFECCAVRHREEEQAFANGVVPASSAPSESGPGQTVTKRPSCLRSKSGSRSGSAEFGSPREAQAGEEPIVVCVQQVRFASPRVTGNEASARPLSPRSELQRVAEAEKEGEEAEAEKAISMHSDVPEYDPITLAEPVEFEREESATDVKPVQPTAVEQSKDSEDSSQSARPSLAAADISLVEGGKVRVSLLDARQRSRESLSTVSSTSPAISPRSERPSVCSDQGSPKNSPMRDRPRAGSGPVAFNGAAEDDQDQPRICLDQNSPIVSPGVDRSQASSDVSPRNIPRGSTASGKQRVSVSLLNARGTSKEPQASPAATTPAAKSGHAEKVAVSLLGARAAGSKAASPVPGPSVDGTGTSAAPPGKVAVSLLKARSGLPKAATPASTSTATAKSIQDSKAPAPGEKVAFSLLGARGGPKAKAKATVQQESKSPAQVNMELKGDAKADQNGHKMDLAETAAKAGLHASAQQEILDQPEVEPQLQPETGPVDPPGLAVPLVKPPAREEWDSGRSNATSSTAPGTPSTPNDGTAEAGEDDGLIRTWQWRNNALDVARQMTPAQQLSTLSTKEMEQFTADLKRMMKTYDQANPKASVSTRRLNEARYMNILREKYVYKRE